MPEKEKIERRRMVVEEVEIPNSDSKTEEKPIIQESKPETPQDEAKASSQDLISNKIPLVDSSAIEVEKQKSPVFWILIPGIFILGAILGGIIFYQKGVNTINVDESPIPVTSPTANVATPTPSASPSANVDISKFDVTVFNGSGIAGEAGKVKSLLVDAGFTVTSTGNAATYDYTKTIIKAKSTVSAGVIQKLKDALSKNYLLGDNQTLSSSATTDIQVVVGSSKAK